MAIMTKKKIDENLEYLFNSIDVVVYLYFVISNLKCLNLSQEEVKSINTILTNSLLGLLRIDDQVEIPSIFRPYLKSSIEFKDNCLVYEYDEPKYIPIEYLLKHPIHEKYEMTEISDTIYRDYYYNALKEVLETGLLELKIDLKVIDYNDVIARLRIFFDFLERTRKVMKEQNHRLFSPPKRSNKRDFQLLERYVKAWNLKQEDKTYEEIGEIIYKIRNLKFVAR
jgi:hypothetical protein